LEYDLVCDKIDRRSRFFFLWGNELGYAWLFPTFEGYYVGLGYIGKTQKKVRSYLDDFLQHSTREGFLPEKYAIRGIFGGPDPVSVVPRYCERGIVLCGDSMGLVSQLAGDGIYYAMQSGRLAARAFTERNLAAYKELVNPLVRQVTVCGRIPPRPVAMAAAHAALLAMRFAPLRRAICRRFFLRDV